MMAAEQRGEGQTRPEEQEQARETSVSGITPGSPAPGRVRRKTTVESLEAEVAQRLARPRRHRHAQVDRPAVAHCDNLDALRALTPDAARHHVDAYLRTVMSAREAADFEALRYRWELHLVELDQLSLVRRVDLNRRKLAHYRAVLRRGGAFPPLIGLGGEGSRATDDVLLLDGYHRAIAMRDVGLCFAWMWLAVDIWKPLPRPTMLTAGCNRR